MAGWARFLSALCCLGKAASFEFGRAEGGLRVVAVRRSADQRNSAAYRLLRSGLLANGPQLTSRGLVDTRRAYDGWPVDREID